jgi:aryl-alcohol dehydrogenase-like predicted oxidoreductase
MHHLVKVEDVKKALGPGDAIETFLKAKEEGKIKYIGFSAHSVDPSLSGRKSWHPWVRTITDLSIQTALMSVNVMRDLLAQVVSLERLTNLCHFRLEIWTHGELTWVEIPILRPTRG